MSADTWLPEMAKVNPWTDRTLEYLYAIFLEDIKHFPLQYAGYDVWFFSDMEDGKEVLFWHLTSREDKETKERIPDMRRSERLPWVNPCIENYSDSDLLCWDYEEGNRTIKTYVWLKDKDFVVIMKKYKNNSRRLVTSFFIDYESKRKNLAMKYKNRI
ncbi:MAG: hypothetical protein GYA47_10830 [Desulfovibrio sp.]|nr:hypothetical protein [Desulfovibrio sp.]